jgi:hypothetical protein
MILLCRSTMSSQLSSYVPILDGTNYQQWAPAMQSFLMSQGQWKCTRDNKSGPTWPSEEEGKEGDEDYKPAVKGDDTDTLTEWIDTQEKALGNIRLRLHHTIGHQYNDVELPYELWGLLKEKYGTPGMTKAFTEFKGAMDTVIPNGSDPSPALDKMSAHFTNLKSMGFDIPERIQAMMILSKAPLGMETTVQIFAVAAKEKNYEFQVGNVVSSFRTAWETSRRNPRASGSGQNQQRANKLSAVQRSGAPPQFTQQQQPYQQQQRDDGSGYRGQGRGRGRRGKRGGQRAQQQQQLQQAPVQQQYQAPFSPPTQVQLPGPSQPPSYLPQPPWLTTNPLPPQQYAAGPTDQGYIASWTSSEPPLARSPYPPFRNALRLAHRLGVKPTIETMKTLETAEMKKAEDPRPKKRVRTNTTPIELPRGRALGQTTSAKGKEKEKDDDVVSLGYSEDERMAEVDPQDDEQVDYGDHDNQDYNPDGEMGDIAGIYNDYWQVQSLENNMALTLSTAGRYLSP